MSEKFKHDILNRISSMIEGCIAHNIECGRLKRIKRAIEKVDANSVRFASQFTEALKTQ